MTAWFTTIVGALTDHSRGWREELDGRINQGKQGYPDIALPNDSPRSGCYDEV